ncbi:IclR family transcriptional regulator [Microbacterium lacus]|uniref:IclR family transcriptional regulator n=1 Tax=Microbacterium lacus TaxID=415217 RepID=UPI00384B689E
MEEDVDESMGMLDRMTRILQAIQQNDRGLGLSELARRSGLPKSTVSRLVGTLVRHHYLERDGRLIHLGMRVFELGQLTRKPRELRSVALPVMLQLRDRTQESVHLAIRDDREMVCVAVLRGRSGTTSRVRVGDRLPAHATALGKTMLAHSPGSALDAAVDAGLEAWTPMTITDEVRLHRQLNDIRAGALASEFEEFEPDVACAASAVFTTRGTFAGALSVSGRADGFAVGKVTPALRAAGRAVTDRLAAITSAR